MHSIFMQFIDWLYYLLLSNRVSMRYALNKLAQQIVRGGPNGPQANDKFKSMINQPSNLDETLEALALSDTYIFVYATNMIKLMENGDFNIITETRSEENLLNQMETPSQKSKIYGRVLMTIAYYLQIKQRPRYIKQSMIDLAGISLKVLLQDSNNQLYLQNLLGAFIPNYKIDDRFINSPSDSAITPIFMRRDMDFNNLNSYCLAVQIFITMFQFITVQNGLKPYYQYRRSIYIFRNSYLGYFLYFGVQHIKALFAVGSNQNIREVISLTLQLLEAVFMYPFTLSLHQYEIDDDINENITSSNSGDVYLPNFFRHIICDENYLTTIMQYYHYVLDRTQEFEDSRVELNSILKILGRSICSNQYTFKSQEQRFFARNFSQSMIQDICANFKFFDSYYLQAILEIVQKHLTMYDSILVEIKKRILLKVLNFFKIIIMQSQITIFDGKRNPFARAFEITALLSDYVKDKLTQQENHIYHEECQLMMETAFSRITSSEMNKVIQKYGANQPNQIECFQQIYQFFLPIFEANLQRNLTLFQQLDTSRLQPGAKIMWLHLCCQLLPKTQANMRQTAIILKYYQLANKGDSLASLRYIRTLSEQILLDCHEGVSVTVLWRNIEDISHATFQQFMMNIINICIQNFSNSNNEIIDYSLQFFKSIYSNLRKHDTKAFQTYYNIVKQLLSEINTTIFVNPIHFPKRKTFFNVISVIWMNGESIQYIYQIHNMISANIRSGTSQSFCQYLHDITGIIQPVDRHESFQIIAELAIDDLHTLFQMHFKDDNAINYYLNDPFFMKILSKLILGLISDINRKLYFETHTPIPYKIHELVYPIVEKLVTPGREIPYQLTNILQKMINLNPLAPLLSFESIAAQLKQNFNEGYTKLVRCYFQNIQRVSNINWMYDLIEQNVDFMVQWWQQAIFRDIHPNINLKVIAQSRIWSNLRQKELLAKLIFQIGYYDNTYWNVSNYESERQFVNYFATLYA